MFSSVTVPRSACILCCLWLTIQGADNTHADDVAMVQPFIGETTIVVIKVDPQRLALPDLPDTLKSAFPGGEQDYDRWVQDATSGIENLRAATDEQLVYATLGIPLSPDEWPSFLLVKETSESSRQRLVEFLSKLHEIHAFSRNGVSVVMPGHEPNVEASLKQIVPSPRQSLPDAFEAVKEYPIQVLILPPDHVRRAVTELMPQLPHYLGGGPSRLVTDGLVWAACGIDLARPRTEIVVQSSSAGAARDLAEHFPKMMLSIYDEIPDIKKRLSREAFQVLLPLVKPVVEGDRITIRLDELQAMSEGLQLMASAPAAVGARIRRRRNSDSFKSILIAMHNYHDRYKVFPPRDGVRDSMGNSKLSWRVHLLPYLDEKELYDEFELDQPWDSPHNKSLLEKMPNVYKSQWLGIKPGHTTFLAPVGDDTIFGGEKATKFRNIIDGTSNTVTLVEVQPSLSVPWTAPEDYDFDPDEPSNGLRVGTDGMILAGVADGSVQVLRGNMPAEFLLRLFQKSDGQIISWDDVR